MCYVCKIDIFSFPTESIQPNPNHDPTLITDLTCGSVSCFSTGKANCTEAHLISIRNVLEHTHTHLTTFDESYTTQRTNLSCVCGFQTIHKKYIERVREGGSKMVTYGVSLM